MMDRLERYKQLNNSFKKTLVFNLGADSGFYSEFNNMVFAMLYCLKNKYKFILYSADANFKIEKGWEDFFLPFCESTINYIHKKINKKVKPGLSKKQKVMFFIYKLFNKNTYLTYDLWDCFYNAEFEKEDFNIPELGINGNLKEASRIIVKMIYRFNSETKFEVETYINSLELPTKYAALNIRRGDKITEFELTPLSLYLNKLMQVSELRKVFVFTDDYTTIQDIMDEYHNLKLYFFVNKNEKGYVHSDFMKQKLIDKRENLIKMFASVETLSSAEIAIGTYTTNPGLFFGMRMQENKFLSVQKKSWYQFEYDSDE